MKHDEANPRPEEKLGHAMVKARLINENQLKTALDYQRSLGGNLFDVVTKLGFARPGPLQRFLAETGGAGGGAAPGYPPAAASTEEEGSHPPTDTKLRKELAHVTTATVAVAEESEGATEAPGDGSPESAASPHSADPVVEALIGLLVKKGVIRRREIEEALRGAD
jgi:hypothetical protein